MRCLAALLALVLLGTTGCAGGGQKAGGPPPGTIEAVEKEFTIDLSSATASPGKVTFRIRNEGAVEHNFVVFQGTDPKTRKKLAEVDGVKPGEARELSVQLGPGEYHIVCTIPGHEAAGMTTTLKVGQ